MGKKNFDQIIEQAEYNRGGRGHLSIKISHFSDTFDPSANFAGLIIYHLDGKYEWPQPGGIIGSRGYSAKSFYVLIQNTGKWPEREARDAGSGLVHHFILSNNIGLHHKEDKNRVCCGGFAIMEGQTKYSSYWLNMTEGGSGQTSWECDGQKNLSSTETQIVNLAVEFWKEFGKNCAFSIENVNNSWRIIESRPSTAPEPPIRAPDRPTTAPEHPIKASDRPIAASPDRPTVPGKAKQPSILQFRTSREQNCVRFCLIDGNTDNPVCYGDFLQNLQSNRTFRQMLTGKINEVSESQRMHGFYWECVPVSSNLLSSTPFQFMLIPTTSFRSVSVDDRPFAEHFRSSQRVVSFKNLGRDADLIVPCPPASSSSHIPPPPASSSSHIPPPPEYFSHFCSFLREGDGNQIDELWRLTALTLKTRLRESRGDELVWMSTNGKGVSWLSIRLDQSPKYYHWRELKG